MTEKQLLLVKKAGTDKLFNKWRKKVTQKFDDQSIMYFDLLTEHPFFQVEFKSGSNNYWLDYHHYKPIVGAWVLSKFSFNVRDNL